MLPGALSTTFFPPLNTFSAVKDYRTEKARSFTGVGVNKANEVLATQYDNIALSGFETTAALAEKYLDYFFPATEQELQEENCNLIYHMKQAVQVALGIGCRPAQISEPPLKIQEPEYILHEWK
jgi:hypothetical protein